MVNGDAVRPAAVAPAPPSSASFGLALASAAPRESVEVRRPPGEHLKGIEISGGTKGRVRGRGERIRRTLFPECPQLPQTGRK